MVEFTRRRLMSTSLATAIGASTVGITSAEDGDTPNAPVVNGSLKLFATTAFGAEVTGPFVTQDGGLIFSLQHPSRENPAPYDKGGIGYVNGHQFDFDGESDFDALTPPNTDDEQARVRVANGDYELLAQEGEPIGDGSELLGVPTAPDGRNIDQFAGSRYSDFGYTPDMNQFVATDGDGTEGYLFTNFESSPGNLTRMPIRRGEDGAWSADLENTENLVNSEAWREIGGTRINCYGDLSPWGTPLSAEEDYSHPRVSNSATVSDITEAGTGVGFRGASQYWNRPNPTGIQDAINNIYVEDSWYVQGYWALGGVEILAYYLGAEPVDQKDDNATNTTYPIGGHYPNPYRYGYIVDIREPTADQPQPVKYHAFGRAAWECPNVMADQKTVYLSSDGSYKGFYKFVADRPIPSYDDPMDVAGTLYVAKVTNQDAAATQPPADVDLEIDWLELGHATNAEVESWISEFDYVSQVDYLETHAETDWQEDLNAALREADKAVSEKGNQDFITDEEIVEWANQWKQNGPDGVDEDLRKVPFLETRAAAKEVGATVEFRKAEGIDSPPNAKPGDELYVGISELNASMSDEIGDLRMERVDGGLVYSAEIEPGYNISTLKPAIVGPDATDSASVMDSNIVNVDNLLVMEDGRVLLCEDADQFGRSYPNDGLWVFDPAAEHDGDDDRGHGNDSDGHDEDNPGRRNPEKNDSDD